MRGHSQPFSGTVTIAERYGVAGCLHQGSVSSVFLCEDARRGGMLVAVKVLAHNVPSNSAEGLRFRHEMTLAMTTSHPNVVRAYECFDDGDLVGFSMEFADGGDLAGLLTKQERLEIGDALVLLHQIGCGLAAIHDCGIIHRDIKPENILIDAVGCAKIADFGIACLGSGRGSISSGQVVGTVDYISPEFLARGEVSTVSDIYALGVLGYELITGTCPFQGASLIESLRCQLSQDAVPPSRLVGNLPPGVEELLLHAMFRNPDGRIQTAREFVRRIELILNNNWGRTEPLTADHGGEV